MSGEKDSFEIIEALKHAIWTRRPMLGEIIRTHGDKILYDYTVDFLDVNKSKLLDDRKGELLDVVKKLLSERLGDRVASEVVTQMAALPLVSTADHHGPIDHPFWVNSNIISGIPLFEKKFNSAKYLVVFSFASVSVNNLSAYPRGIEFHGGVNGSSNIIKLPILPDKLKMSVVYGTRAFTRDDLEKTHHELLMRERHGDIIYGRAEEVWRIIENNFGSSDVLNALDFPSQVTKINFTL
ncbi:MAG: hypothetical protein WC659_00320 [Patescibacteria group bacterium]